MKYLKYLFILLAQWSFGQSFFQGTILNENKAPIAGAIINIPELNTNISTNNKGIFRIENIPTHPITVNISAIGFENQTIEINTQSKDWTLVLKEKIFVMDEVIVSTGFNKIQSQNVMKVDHETVKEMQQKGAVTLTEGLSNIPGVSQISTGVSAGKPVVRGLSGNRVLVYTQGVRLENQQFGDEHGLGLNDAGVESVEVIKGPASLLYGSDALGGVLYMNPEKFAPEKHWKADVSQKYFSATNGSNSNIGIKTTQNGFKFLSRFSQNAHQDYQIGSSEKVLNSRFLESDFKTAIGFSNAFMNTTIRYNYNKMFIGLPEGLTNDRENTSKPLLPKQEVASHILSLNQLFYLKNSKLELNAGYIGNNRDEFEEGTDPNMSLRLKTWNYDLKWHLPLLGKVESIIGLQGMQQDNQNTAEEILIPNAKTKDIGLYATAMYGWKKHLFQFGLRVDNRSIKSEEMKYTVHHHEDDAHHEDEEIVLPVIDRNFKSFNASFGYKTNFQKLQFRFNIASGFRAPNLAELTSNGVHHGTNRYEEGNPDLKNEQNVQTDLNLEYKSDHVEFFANGFYNHVNNYIYAAPNGEIHEDLPVFAYIQNNAKLYGGEIGVHFHPHPLDWLHLESSYATVIGKRNDGEYLPMIPANNWTNTLRTSFNMGSKFTDAYASLTLQSFFAQEKVAENEKASAGYDLLNFAFGGQFSLGKTKCQLSLNANNILNKTYIPHLSRLKNQDISSMGRNIIIGCQFSI